MAVNFIERSNWNLMELTVQVLLVSCEILQDMSGPIIVVKVEELTYGSDLERVKQVPAAPAGQSPPRIHLSASVQVRTVI